MRGNEDKSRRIALAPVHRVLFFAAALGVPSGIAFADGHEQESAPSAQKVATGDWYPSSWVHSHVLALEAKPSAVTLEPGGETLEWSYDGGRLAIELESTAVAHHRIIRIVKQ